MFTEAYHSGVGLELGIREAIDDLVRHCDGGINCDWRGKIRTTSEGRTWPIRDGYDGRQRCVRAWVKIRIFGWEDKGPGREKL